MVLQYKRIVHFYSSKIVFKAFEIVKVYGNLIFIHNIWSIVIWYDWYLIVQLIIGKYDAEQNKTFWSENVSYGQTENKFCGFLYVCT
jgi:hypothetical protein